jgi:hypothetical protein
MGDGRQKIPSLPKQGIEGMRFRTKTRDKQIQTKGGKQGRRKKFIINSKEFVLRF